MGLKQKIAWATLIGPTALALTMWGVAQTGFTWPPTAVYGAIGIGGVGLVIAIALWCHIGWIWIRAKGLQLGPAIGLALGLLIILCSSIWGAITWHPSFGMARAAPVVAAPNISFQKFALFWVRTQKDIYQLAVIAKLYNADADSHYLNGLIFNRSEWKMIPRGGYMIRHYTEFPDKVDFIEDNFIKPSDVGYYKKLLPVQWDMTITAGTLPDFILLGEWRALIGNATVLIPPRAFGICNTPLTSEQWSDLLKPKSQIDIENLNYFPMPSKLSSWNENTVVGVPCAPTIATPAPQTETPKNAMGPVIGNQGAVTQGQTGDNFK